MSFNVMTIVTIHNDFGPQGNKICHCFSFFPSICHKVIRPDAMILVFLTLRFMSEFSLSSFTLIKRLFSSSSLSATRVVPSAYLRLLMFSWQSWFQLVIHPARHFAWCTLHIVEINGDNIQPCHTPFLILNQSIVPCPVQTVASCPAYKFLRRQVWWSGIPIS